MTIALHWWMLPAFVVLVGFWQFATIRGTGGFIDGLGNVVWLFGSVIVAGALTIGHFL